MSVTLQDKYKCEECGHICDEAEMLVAANPFDLYSGEVITGCPRCKQPECMEKLCDVYGCQRTVSIGTPMEDGSYRQTCHLHEPRRNG